MWSIDKASFKPRREGETIGTVDAVETGEKGEEIARFTGSVNFDREETLQDFFRQAAMVGKAKAAHAEVMAQRFARADEIAGEVAAKMERAAVK